MTSSLPDDGGGDNDHRPHDHDDDDDKNEGRQGPTTRADDEDEDEDETTILLPFEINRAAAENEVEKVMQWLGGPTGAVIPPRRLNAKCAEHFDRTLLHEAAYENSIGLMNLLLQDGARVDPVSSTGWTPLNQACRYPRCDDAVRLLLSWGADTTIQSFGHNAEWIARNKGSDSIAKLLRSPLGGRRCEIVGLVKRTELNGLTCIATRYLPNLDRYVVEFEWTNDVMKVKPENLKRRDRVRTDSGIYVSTKGQNRFHIGIFFRTNTREEDERRFRRDFEPDGNNWWRLKQPQEAESSG